MQDASARTRVFCVDDNAAVLDALRVHIGLSPRLEWAGSLPSADGLLEAVRDDCPDVIVLDIDMPGLDPFVALAGVVGQCPNTRVIVFSGHVRQPLVDRSIEAGAWGYVAKDDGAPALMDAVARTVAGEFALSPGVQAALRI